MCSGLFLIGHKSRGVNPGGDASPPIIFEGGMHPQSSPPIIYQSSPPIIYRTLQNCQNCFSHPAKIVKLSQRKIMTEKSESISMKTFFFLETICFWAEITNVFPRFPRNSVAICATFDGSVSSPAIIFTDIRHCIKAHESLIHHYQRQIQKQERV